MKWVIVMILLVLVGCSKTPLVPPSITLTASDPIVPEPLSPLALETEVEKIIGIVADGDFVSRASRVKGYVVIDRLIDQSYKLTFSNFEASRTENLLVVLTKNRYVISSRDIGDYFEIGELKGEIKNQFYFFPRTVNITDYQSLSLIQKDNRIVEGSAVLGFVQ